MFLKVNVKSDDCLIESFLVHVDHILEVLQDPVTGNAILKINQFNVIKKEFRNKQIYSTIETCQSYKSIYDELLFNRKVITAK